MEELIIQNESNLTKIIVLEDNKIVEYHELSAFNQSHVGNIYLGKITRVLPKLNTIFVDIGLEKSAYLELKTLDKKYKSGDKILVKVKKDGAGQKGAKLTTSTEDSELYQKHLSKDAPVLLFEANSLKDAILKEYINSNTSKIYTNDKALYNALKTELKNYDIKYKDVDFLLEFGLLTEFETISKKKIWLKSGGNIVIEKTEALTAIDVNSAKSIKKGVDREELLLNTNIEAALEVLRQIRLKDIKGMILLDFINLKSEKEREDLVKLLKNEAKRDSKKVQVYGFTKLGLCEITRSL